MGLEGRQGEGMGEDEGGETSVGCEINEKSHKKENI